MRLRQLTLKFDAYKKQSNHTMRQHLTIMSNMTSELRSVGPIGHELTDLRINLTHIDNIKTFVDVV